MHQFHFFWINSQKRNGCVFSNSWGTSILSSVMVILAYIPSLHSNQQCIRVPFPQKNWLEFVSFWILAWKAFWLMRSDACLWIYLHSLMASDPERISTCLLTICSSLFEKCLFLSLAHFLTKLLVALLCFFTFLHVLDVNPLLQIFSSILWADTLLHYFLTVQKL